MNDPLAQFWVHDVVVERWAGATGAHPDGVYADPVTETGFVRDGQRLVTNDQGEQVTASAMVAFPASVARIPVGSKVTLPLRFADRRSTVIASAVGDGGGLPTPDHQQIALL